MKRLIPALAALCGLVCMSQARGAEEPHPSMRRLYMLCAIEDPVCFRLFREAYTDFVADPTWEVCMPGGDNPRCPGGSHIEVFTCRMSRDIPLDEIFGSYMREVPKQRMQWSLPGRIGVYMAVNALVGCR